MPQPSLKGIDADGQIRRIVITDRICIGRTCKGILPQKRICLDDLRVSRDHAEIVWTAGQLQIVDNSRNGTWINHHRMSAGATCNLLDGDRIVVGGMEFLVSLPPLAADTSDPKTKLTQVSSVSQDITTLIADIRDFSAYVQHHAATETHGVIKRIFGDFSMIVENFNGTIKDYAGDAIFAFWEHQFKDPAAQTEMACRAAIQQTQCLATVRIVLAEHYADFETLQIGWGLTTGPVTLSSLGSRAADLAVVGDCVNLAARLASLANKAIPADILICAQTAKFAGDRFERRDLGLVPIRGRQGPEHIYALGAA